MSSRGNLSNKGRKTLLGVICFLLSSLLLLPVSSQALLGKSCLEINSNFVPRYIHGIAEKKEVDSFFECIINFTTFFLRHKETKYSGYLRAVELQRLIQLIVVPEEAKALTIAKSVLRVKTAIIGGNENGITDQEFHTFQDILRVLQKQVGNIRLQAPMILRILNGHVIPSSQFLFFTQKLKQFLTGVGNGLAKIRQTKDRANVNSDLYRLSKISSDLKRIGLLPEKFTDWDPLMHWLRQWKKIFSQSSKTLILPSQWPILMSDLGSLTSLWLYYNAFLKDKSWLQEDTIRHSEYVLTQSLYLTMQIQDRTPKKQIRLKDIDELARRTWFFPDLSSSSFSLTLRSTFCFVMNRLANNKPCQYQMSFQDQEMKINFKDRFFRFTEQRNIRVLPNLGSVGEFLTRDHIKILRKYLLSWKRSETYLTKKFQMPNNFFGSPNDWLFRNMDVTSDLRLRFHKRKTNVPLLRLLNWQSHITKLVTSAYLKENQKIDRQVWKKIVREWTGVVASVYPKISWQNLQKEFLKFFEYGDFLTSQSNGNGVLEPEEILELFALSASSLKMTLLATSRMSICNTVDNLFDRTCIFGILHFFPRQVFDSFPNLEHILSRNLIEKEEYFIALESFKHKNEELNFGELFETFMLMHYEENMIEYLNVNRRDNVSMQELSALADTFFSIIKRTTPIIRTEREAFGFISYLFYYDKIPIVGENSILAPLKFNQWLLQPEKWRHMRVRRIQILRALITLNRSLTNLSSFLFLSF